MRRANCAKWSAEFRLLNVEHHPEITFKGNQVEIHGEHDYAVTGDLTIRGVNSASVPERKLGLRWWRDVLIRSQPKRHLDDR